MYAYENHWPMTRTERAGPGEASGRLHQNAVQERRSELSREHLGRIDLLLEPHARGRESGCPNCYPPGRRGDYRP